MNPNQTESQDPAAEEKLPNRRAEVIEAAVHAFYAKGYSGAGIQEVADAVGMHKGSLYYYIESKEDMLFQICQSVHLESREILDEVMAMDERPVERLRIHIERHVRWYLENTEIVGVFFRDWRFLTGERLQHVAERRRGYDLTIRELIAAAQAGGEVDPDLKTKYASFYILSAVNSVPSWYRADGADSARTIAANYAALTVATLTGAVAPTEPTPEPGAQ